MNEEENKGVETLEVSEEVTQPAESENLQERSDAKALESKKRNDVEHNWAEARRKMQEQDRQIKELSEHLQKIQPPKPQVEEDELDKLGNDDIVTKGHVMKLAEKMARKIANEAIKQREASTVEERVKLKFSDYDELVTTDNIEFLKQNEPELALSIAHNPDPYAQAVAVYKALKRMGIEKPSIDKEKAVKNAQKPLSVNAVSKSSAIGNAHMFENGLTPELKASLLKEMREAAKRA